MSLNDLQPSARIQQIDRTAFVVALAHQEIVFVATRDGPIAIQADGVDCISREEVINMLTGNLVPEHS